MHPCLARPRHTLPRRAVARHDMPRSARNAGLLILHGDGHIFPYRALWHINLTRQ
jgi:hypothetical protein